MKKKGFLIISIIALCITACRTDTTNAGSSILGPDDKIIVLTDTFPILSGIDSCETIISATDSFLLGEIETDYGLMRASIMTQLACPEGYSYPANSEVDSICLFMYYNSWVGDGRSPLAINAYMMDKKTFSYSASYYSDLDISEFCSREYSILTNRSIVAAAEKRDSIRNNNGKYIPVIRMKLNDYFKDYFWDIRSFKSQDEFNEEFKGLLIESSFGSSTVLNVSDIALGVYYHFAYSKASADTTVRDMKVFYANSEVRTVNPIDYLNKEQWIKDLKEDSANFNYVIAPAGVYTRLKFPIARIADSIMSHMLIDSTVSDISTTYHYKRPYVNLAEIKVMVENVYTGTAAEKTREDWLQPAGHMLLIKESDVENFFRLNKLPTDTSALLCELTKGTDSIGESYYYYSYDLSDFLTNYLRKREKAEVGQDKELSMMLIPVTVRTGNASTTAVTSVKEQQTISATKFRSAQFDMNLKLLYSGF